MPSFFVRCPNCATAFPTRLASTEADRVPIVVSGLALRCPRCGLEESYFTKDLFIPPAPSGGPGGGVSSGGRTGRGAGSARGEVRTWGWFRLIRF